MTRSPSSRRALQRLGAGVIELARLADDDRAGAADEDAVDVGALGHLKFRFTIADVRLSGDARANSLVQTAHRLNTDLGAERKHKAGRVGAK